MTEAEYAFQKRKNVIPLLLQQSYQADGWLGLIIGAKLFHDFSGKYSFGSRVSNLMKELQRLSDTKVDGPVISRNIQVHVTLHVFS